MSASDEHPLTAEALEKAVEPIAIRFAQGFHGAV